MLTATTAFLEQVSACIDDRQLPVSFSQEGENKPCVFAWDGKRVDLPEATLLHLLGAPDTVVEENGKRVSTYRNNAIFDYVAGLLRDANPEASTP